MNRFETPQERDFRVAAALATLRTSSPQSATFRLALVAANPALRWFGAPATSVDQAAFDTDEDRFGPDDTPPFRSA